VPLDLALLVLLSALLHASWNALVKSGRDPLTMQFGIFSVAAVWGVLLLPFIPVPDIGSVPYLIASIAIHVLYYMVLAAAYSAGDLSLVYPVARGSAPMMVAILAIPFAGEFPGPVQIIGVLLVSAGIFTLVPGPGAVADRRAMLLALATGVTVAGYTVADGTGVRHTAEPLSYIAWLFALQGGAFAVATILWRGPVVVVETARTWRLAFVGGTIAVIGYGIAVWVMGHANLASTSALRETSVIIAALLGTTLLREPFGLRRVVAAVIVCAGAALLSLAD